MNLPFQPAAEAQNVFLNKILLYLFMYPMNDDPETLDDRL